MTNEVKHTCTVCGLVGLESAVYKINNFDIDTNPEKAICYTCELYENWGYCDSCNSKTNEWHLAPNYTYEKSYDSVCIKCRK